MVAQYLPEINNTEVNDSRKRMKKHRNSVVSMSAMYDTGIIFYVFLKISLQLFGVSGVSIFISINCGKKNIKKFVQIYFKTTQKISQSNNSREKFS